MEGVVLLGPDLSSGVYVLWIDVRGQCGVCFGRFAGGRPVTLAAGPYLYVGSAMGTRGASTLARRLLRHATRRDGLPHPVRPALCAAWSQLPPGQKRLRWHVDYLLDHAAAELTGVVAVRTVAPREAKLADMLAQQEWIEPVAPGLGASDHRGSSHLLRVTGRPTACAAALVDIGRAL